MPIYLYKCKDCGHEFEEMRIIAERNEETECPECQSKTPERVVAGNQTMFALKGDRWSNGEARRRWGDNTNY
jgi:putative FmdB family regulatory protein